MPSLLTRVRLAALAGFVIVPLTAGVGTHPQAPASPGTQATAAAQATPAAQTAPAAPAAPAGQSTTETHIEVIAVDKDGKPLDVLQPADVSIWIDGAPRPVLSVRRVSRGPGAASDATRRLAAAAPGVTFAAEPSRSVMVVVDQATMIRGDERPALQAGGAFLDRLGLGDRVGVLRLPMTGDQHIELTTERPPSRDALARVKGQTMRTAMARQDAFGSQIDRDRAAGIDPDRAADPDRATEPDRSRLEQPIATEFPVNSAESEMALARSSLGGLAALLKSMQPVPGRKVIALFSAGFSNSTPAQVMEASAVAIAARATIYAFGLPAAQDDPQNQPDVQALQTLARNTGGSFAMIGRNADRAIDRVIAELSTTHIVAVAADPGDTGARQRAIRLQSTRKDVTLRAPAWFTPALDPGDVVPEPRQPAPSAAAAAAVPAGPGAPAPPRPARETKPSAPSAKDLELELALGRMFDYVEAYEKQYAALVAEEEYRQASGQQSVRLKSDLLLVRQEGNEGWVSFRDVFEVNGKAVRDREDRLKKLFLDPGVQADAQLMRIKEESARYNIGPLERNINVPLFQLKFVGPQYRARSQYKLVGRSESEGVPVWRIEFTEVVRPTIIRDRDERSVPITGYYLVDQGTGAIVETGLKINERLFQAEIVVKYRLDQGLGMWVPARMTESYKTSGTPIRGSVTSLEVGSNKLEGEAKYAKFRRFQVKTEETVTIPKK
jgi:VWFA-related protein